MAEDPKVFNNWKQNVEDISIITQLDCLRIIELNISNKCNLRCPFCPQSKQYEYDIEYMNLDIIDEIAKQLFDIEYNGYICIAGHGEPTLHREIKKIIEKLSSFKVILVTNGTFLCREDFQILSNFCTLKVSIHDWKNLRKYEEKFNGINAIFRNHDMLNPQMNLYNRGGYLNTNIKSGKCNYPFYKIMIDVDGTYRICEADWKNISRTIFSIYDIKIKDYFVQYLNVYRQKMLLSKARLNVQPCCSCDIDGQLIGNKFIDFWKKTNGSIQ